MRTLTATFLIGLGLLMLAGCGTTKPSKFYLMTPAGDSIDMTAASGNPAVGIGPIMLPAYLDRPEIAQRLGKNQIHYAGSHRWAEPLRVSFMRVLVENIGAMLPTDRIYTHPWGRSVSVDYQVEVDVSRFDSDTSGNVVLAANWKIIRTADNSILIHKKTSYPETAGDPDYAAIVAAQSSALQALSKDISAAITADQMP
ncbi:MAG: PqiC family protein [Pseudomonadota bacterium]